MIKAKKRVFVIAAGVITIVGGMLAGCGRGAKEKEDEYVDLTSYYGVSAEGEYGIVVNGNPEGTAVTVDGKIYLPQDVVVRSINSQFYYDKGNNRIRYAAPYEIVTADADGEDKRVITYGDTIYLELTYVTDNSEIRQFTAEDPDRIVIFTELGARDTCRITEGTKLRTAASVSGSVLTDLSEGQSVYKCSTILPYGDTINGASVQGSGTSSWTEVVTEQGIRGYVDNGSLEAGEPLMLSPNTEQPEYPHLVSENKICLGWQLMTNTDGNAEIGEKLQGVEGLNVISPTWYTVADGTGNITSYASAEYVEEAHDRGIQVWALINDFESDKDGRAYILEVLESTEGRMGLIEKLMREAESYGFDGINIDFERIDLEHGRDYVQFMRELSVACRNNGLVLSADMYVPMSYNQYYGRKDVGKVVDYMIVMGYDEHWAGGSSAGSVASIAYVTNGINNTIKVVDADRVINAIPFYTRIWSETPANIADGSGVYVEDNINGNYYLSSRAVGMDAAERDLRENETVSIWLEDIGQYYGEYVKNGVLYRTWLEEERSVELKLSVMENAGLAGVACWQLGYEKQEIWDVIQAYLNN